MQAAMKALAASPVMSAAEALTLVSQFFDKEWPETREQDVTVTRLTGGAVNSVQIVKRDNRTTNSREPDALIVRHHRFLDRGSEPGSLNLTVAEENLLMYEMSNRKWAPHLYGIFPAGRVEEYVNAHPLTADEAADPLIRRDIARTYARFASLKLPLVNHKRNALMDRLTTGMRKTISRKEDLVMKFTAIDHPDVKSVLEVAFVTDWMEECKWVTSLFHKYECKRGLTHYDSNLMNILVRDEESECRTLLVDYETAIYSYRCIDIGSHFAERMFCWTHATDQSTGKSFPSLDERRSFCEDYLNECHALGQTLAEDESVEKLVSESRVGVLFFALRTVTCLLAYPEPASIRATKVAIDLYHQAKSDLLSSS